ncbi:hypothetical protein TNCV_2206511 [Trichonephila clavipes]|uniref:Uncharacterized protein n=1 Tax=Trichonephila clavipes TaxID=2585209 RepID=A0A8X6S5V5_TRICX|nr:hypothetical protein TNCV_2206511 [Trichonephila clavipes]
MGNGIPTTMHVRQLPFKFITKCLLTLLTSESPVLSRHFQCSEELQRGERIAEIYLTKAFETAESDGREKPNGWTNVRADIPSVIRGVRNEQPHPDVGEYSQLKTPKKTAVLPPPSQEVFEVTTIGMYARTTPTRHGLADMFENTGHFTDRSSSDGHSCHQVHFIIDRRVINRGSERSMFRQVLFPQANV